jgi:hypothetical protein
METSFKLKSQDLCSNSKLNNHLSQNFNRFIYLFYSKSMETRHKTGIYTSSVWFPIKCEKEEKS